VVKVLKKNIDGLIFTMGGSTYQPTLDKKIHHELKAKFYKHFTVSKKPRDNNISFCTDHWRYEDAVKD
jgi:hypothetical protein